MKTKLEKLEVKKEKAEKLVEKLKKKEEGKKKAFWDRKWRKSKLKKPQNVAIIYLRNNGRAEALVIKSEDGLFNIYGKTFHEDTACIYTLGKDRIPLAVIQEWNMIPIGTKEYQDKSIFQKISELQDHAIKAFRRAELVRMSQERERGQLNWKAILLGIIVLAIVYAIWRGAV